MIAFYLICSKVAFLSNEIKKEDDKPNLAIIKDVILRVKTKSIFCCQKNKLRKVKINSEIESNSDYVVVKMYAGDKVVLNPKKLKDGSFVSYWVMIIWKIFLKLCKSWSKNKCFNRFILKY